MTVRTSEWAIDTTNAGFCIFRSGRMVSDGLPDLSAALAFIAKVAGVEERLEAWLRREMGRPSALREWVLQENDDDGPARWRAIYTDNGVLHEAFSPDLAEAVRVLIQFGGPEWAEALNIDPDWYVSPDHEPRLDPVG